MRRDDFQVLRRKQHIALRDCVQGRRHLNYMLHNKEYCFKKSPTQQTRSIKFPSFEFNFETQSKPGEWTMIHFDNDSQIFELENRLVSTEETSKLEACRNSLSQL